MDFQGIILYNNVDSMNTGIWIILMVLGWAVGYWLASRKSDGVIKDLRQKISDKGRRNSDLQMKLEDGNLVLGQLKAELEALKSESNSKRLSDGKDAIDLMLQEYKNEKELAVVKLADEGVSIQCELNEKIRERVAAEEALKELIEKRVELCRQQELDRGEGFMLAFAATDIDDLVELEKLRGRFPKLSGALGKAMYEVYVKRLIDDLGRSQGAKNTTGIYLIGNVEDGRCYVGQAVDIGGRWITHVKRAMGVEEPTSNKLYPALKELWKFRFEVLEKCEKEELGKKEKYWQEMYKCKEWGYSIK